MLGPELWVEHVPSRAPVDFTRIVHARFAAVLTDLAARLGWRSSFSSTAAVMRLVRTAGLSAQGLAFYDDYEHS